MSLVSYKDADTEYIRERIVNIARETVRSLYAASRSKTGDPKCSEAVSAWVKKKATPETHAQLAKCRAMARTGSQAAKLRGAGQEAKAQHLEHRLKSGEPLGVGERKAKAKALIAERAAKAKPKAVEPQHVVEPHKVPEIPSTDDILARRSEAQFEARQQAQKSAEAKQQAKREEHKRKNDMYVAQSEAASRRGIKPFERGTRVRAAEAVKKLPHGERAAKLAAIQENLGSSESLHGKKQKSLPDRLAAIRARKSPEVSGAMATIKAAGSESKPESEEQMHRRLAEAEQQRMARRQKSKKLIGGFSGDKITPQIKYRAAAAKASSEGAKGFKKGTISLSVGGESKGQTFTKKIDLPAHIKGNLAVHKTYAPHGGTVPNSYRVTHTETGMGIGPAVESASRAKEIAHAIHRRGIDVGKIAEGLSSTDPVQKQLANKHLKFIKSLFGRTA